MKNIRNLPKKNIFESYVIRLDISRKSNDFLSLILWVGNPANRL